MVSRYTGACLGLVAFAVSIVAGLAVNNPPTLVLSRALWALVVFCVIGLVLGGAAQAVINEHHRRREGAVLAAFRADQTAQQGTDQVPDANPQDEPQPTEPAEA